MAMVDVGEVRVFVSHRLVDVRMRLARVQLYKSMLSGSLRILAWSSWIMPRQAKAWASASCFDGALRMSEEMPATSCATLFTASTDGT